MPDCDGVPTFRLQWPGITPPPELCLAHAHDALTIANLIGLVVAVEPIAPSGKGFPTVGSIFGRDRRKRR